MPKRRIGELNDFTPKGTPKPPRIKNYREGTRFSFQIPKDKLAPPHDCQPEFSIKPADIKSNLKSGRSDGSVVTYDAAQIQNYKLSYPRFASGIDLIPSALNVGNDGSLNYRFCSSRAPGGFWETQILPIDTSPGTYIEAGGPLFILCPRPYYIDTVTSDGTSFKWTKLPGGRQAQVLPDNVIDPELIIFDSPGQPEPIRFKVELANKPQINDVLEIYTQPIEFVDGLSVNIYPIPDGSPCRQVSTVALNQFKVAPIPTVVGASIFSLSSPLPLTWSLPECDPNYLVLTVWQQNTTGAYLDVQSFAPSAERLFYPVANVHYRAATYFRIGDREVAFTGPRFYFAPNQLERGIGARAADKILGVSFGATRSITKFNFDVKRINNNDSFDRLSYGSSCRFDRLSLGAKTINSIDTYSNISWGNSYKITRLNLGGVIIG